MWGKKEKNPILFRNFFSAKKLDKYNYAFHYTYLIFVLGLSLNDCMSLPGSHKESTMTHWSCELHSVFKLYYHILHSMLNLACGVYFYSIPADGNLVFDFNRRSSGLKLVELFIVSNTCNKHSPLSCEQLSWNFA